MDTFSALSVPTRRSILELLATNGKLSASQIVQCFTISAPAISQHLKVLTESELVTVEKNAQRRIYAINAKKIAEVEQWAANTVNMWERRLDSLDTVLQKSINDSNQA
jgi:DNA-binding transcriptional ArsR family regulator